MIDCDIVFDFGGLGWVVLSLNMYVFNFCVSLVCEILLFGVIFFRVMSVFWYIV